MTIRLERADAILHYNAMEGYWLGQIQNIPAYYNNSYEWGQTCRNKASGFRQNACTAAMQPEGYFYNAAEADVALVSGTPVVEPVVEPVLPKTPAKKPASKKKRKTKTKRHAAPANPAEEVTEAQTKSDLDDLVLMEEEEEVLEDVLETIELILLQRKKAKKNGEDTKPYTKRIRLARKEEIRCRAVLHDLYLSA